MSTRNTGTSILNVAVGGGAGALEKATDAEIARIEASGYEVVSVSHASHAEPDGTEYWTVVIAYRAKSEEVWVCVAYKDSKGSSHALATDRRYPTIPSIGDWIELLPATDTDDEWEAEVERRELTANGLIEIFVEVDGVPADRKIAALREAGYT